MNDIAGRGLHFHFTWAEPSGDKAADLTLGSLEARLDDTVVWPGGEFQWSWIELLEWLGLNWRDLTTQTLPFETEPESFEELEEFVQEQDLALRIAYPHVAQADALWEFLESHDLARALQGADTFTLLIWRDGDTGHILLERTGKELPWHKLEHTLKHLGNEIVSRLESFENLDSRAVEAINTWNGRS